MDRIEWRFFLAAALLSSAMARASADEDVVIERWYSALLVADRTELSELLAGELRMKLDDIGVVQDKQDFIASIHEWRGAVAVATIRHRTEKSESGEIMVLACYDFPETTR